MNLSQARRNEPARRKRSLCLLILIGALTACASAPPIVGVDESAMLPLLGYAQQIQSFSPQELARERVVLAAVPPTPSVQVRTAMLLGQPRATNDLVRALGLLDTVLKSSAPEAVSLQPLARTLASQYQERLRLETQNEKLGQQLRESREAQRDSQRRNDELQKKLEALTDIEQSLSTRPPRRNNR